METILYQNKVYRVTECPTCHKSDRLTIESHDGGYTVCCGHCTDHSRGALAATPARAVRNWNAGKSGEVA